MPSGELELRLAALSAGIRSCRACRLAEQRIHAVPGEGPANRPDAVILGEAPGADEDASGRPFTGRSGVFLDAELTRHGIARERLFITSSVKCRPPGNRDPRPDELAACRSRWLLPQISLLDPPLIVLFGRIAAIQLLGLREPLAKLRGRSLHFQGRSVLATFHPAAAMRFPAAKAGFAEDLDCLATRIGGQDARSSE